MSVSLAHLDPRHPNTTKRKQQTSPDTATPVRPPAIHKKKKKVHKKKKLMVDSRTDTPLKMTEAKRKAHMWAVFFHTLETIDVITVSEGAQRARPRRRHHEDLRARENAFCNLCTQVETVFFFFFFPTFRSCSFHATRWVLRTE